MTKAAQKHRSSIGLVAGFVSVVALATAALFSSGAGCNKDEPATTPPGDADADVPDDPTGDDPAAGDESGGW